MRQIMYPLPRRWIVRPKKLGSTLSVASRPLFKRLPKGDEILINSIPRALAETDFVCSSVNIGSTKTGINMTAVRDMGRIIKEASQADPMGPGKLVVFANAVEDNPFMAGAFHGVGEADVVINVGVSGPGVVQRAIEKVPGASFDVLAETVKKTAFKITRVGQLVGQMASERLGVEFGIVDLSLAPTPAVGDSVARVLEAMGLEVVGTHGTTAALALLNDQVKKVASWLVTKLVVCQVLSFRSQKMKG